MFKPTGDVVTAGDIAATARAGDENAAALLSLLAGIFRTSAAPEAAALCESSEARLRDQLKLFVDQSQSASVPPFDLAASGDPVELAQDLILDLHMNAAALFEVLEALSENQAAQDEAAHFCAERKIRMAEFHRSTAAPQQPDSSST